MKTDFTISIMSTFSLFGRKYCDKEWGKNLAFISDRTKNHVYFRDKKYSAIINDILKSYLKINFMVAFFAKK